jgi:hypothetical protein
MGAPYLQRMGLLEKLGLRSDHDTFAAWLAERVPRLGDGDEEMIEVDRRVTEFADQHGEAGLLEAVDRWIDGTDGYVWLKDTILLQQEDAWIIRRISLKARRGVEGHGLLMLERLLTRIGALQHRLIPAEQERSNSLPPIDAMADVLWPLSRAEQDLRRKLVDACRIPTDTAKSELFALRSLALVTTATPHYEKDWPALQELMKLVLTDVAARVNQHEASWLEGDLRNKRVVEYSEAISAFKVDGVERHRLPFHAIGRQFARFCGQNRIEVRQVGAEEFARGCHRLQPLVETYTRSAT